MSLVKLLQGLFLLLLAAVLSVASLLTASALKWAGELPSLDEIDAYDLTATSRIYARDGTQIGEIVPVVGEDRAGTNRIPVSLDEVSPAALMAIVAYEDDQFYDHYGFDVPGLLRAFYEEFFGSSQRGGSTITTQVIKNTVLKEIRGERSLERKAKELMLAVELERRLTKAEILQRYVNVVFWGGNAYGIRAAAQAYFGKEPIELTLAEGLYLARLIPGPNERHDDFVAARASMATVLERMVRQGVISEDRARETWLAPLEPRGWEVEYDENGQVVSAERTGEAILVRRSVSSDLSDHVALAVRNWMTDRYGENVVFGTGGFRIFTTIDVKAQRAANEASARAEVPEGAQLAIVGIDPQTGEVLAMVGEKLAPDGTARGQLNRATQSKRQPGSSFKPIVYATAIEQTGFTQATVLLDEPISLGQEGQDPYEPENHDHLFMGPATVREHLNLSRNIPAVKALEAASPEAVAERARELGYENVEPFYSLALGSFEVSPLEHAAAFTAFANEGVQVEPHFVERVEDADGNVLYEASPRQTQVWSPQTAYVMLDMMHGNVADRGVSTGFSNRAAIDGRWVAGKTGTTNDERDIWFVGLTPGMVAAVWIGYDDNRSIPTRIDPSVAREDGRVNSSRQPIYAWKDFVENALRGRPAGEFPVPDGIVFHRIDRISGVPVEEGGTRVAFRASDRLRSVGLMTDLTIEIPVDTRTGLRASASTPPEDIELVEVAPDEVDQYLPPPLPEQERSRAGGAVEPERGPAGLPAGAVEPDTTDPRDFGIGIGPVER